jgi:FkbM family methyltransferase
MLTEEPANSRGGGNIEDEKQLKISSEGTKTQEALKAIDEIKVRLDVFAVETTKQLIGLQRSNEVLRQAVEALERASEEKIRTSIEKLQTAIEGNQNSISALENLIELTSQGLHVQATGIVAALAKCELALEARFSQLHRSIIDISATQKPPAVSANGVIAIEMSGGLLIGVPAEEWRLAAWCQFRGLLEPGLMLCLERLIGPGTIFVDVGASIGIVTIHAARLVGAEGKVYSFEPSPRTFAILRDNVQVNGLLESGQIELRQMALLNQSGSRTFYVYPRDSTHNTFFSDGRDAEATEVQVSSLDVLLPTGSRVNVVKIDAEGAEPFILRGMRRVILENPEITIVLEFAPEHLTRAGVSAAGFLDELASDGFDIHVVHHTTGVLHRLSQEQILREPALNLCIRKRASN